MDSDSEKEEFEKDWSRMNENLKKAGYREGITNGKEDNLEKTSERVFHLFFNHSFKLSQLRGIIEALSLSMFTKTKPKEDEKNQALFVLSSGILHTLNESLKTIKIKCPSEDDDTVNSLQEDNNSHNQMRKLEETLEKEYLLLKEEMIKILNIDIDIDPPSMGKFVDFLNKM